MIQSKCQDFQCCRNVLKHTLVDIWEVFIIVSIAIYFSGDSKESQSRDGEVSRFRTLVGTGVSGDVPRREIQNCPNDGWTESLIEWRELRELRDCAKPRRVLVPAIPIERGKAGRVDRFLVPMEKLYPRHVRKVY